MAEEEYISRDKYRADLADLRHDMAQFQERVLVHLADMRTEIHTEFSNIRGEMASLRGEMADVRVGMANLRAEYSQRVPLYAAIGGLVGGLIAAVAKIF